MSEIVLAVPSKGRLEEQTREVFAKAGLPIRRPGGARSYQGTIDGFDGATIRFYPAGEIARELMRGGIDIGVTGLDLVHESSEAGPAEVRVVRPLGFGAADVVVAVPDAWIDVESLYDLSEVAADFRARHGRWLRVATKYINITRRHFLEHGIGGYRIVESLGATEAAPASGSADFIVDITTTGATLRANGLKVLGDGVLLRSEAALVVSRAAESDVGKRALLKSVLARFG